MLSSAPPPAPNLADAISLQRAVHCALSRLRFDIATLPPGAVCGDPIFEQSLAEPESIATSRDRNAGLQVRV